MAANQIALVTGGNKGIGFEIVRGLAAHGVTVLLGARDAKRGASAADKLRLQGLDVSHLPLDVAQPASIAEAAQAIKVHFGRLDILVNNAAVNLESTAGLTPLTTPLEVVQETYQTNVFGPIAMIQALLPLLMESPAGRIVNVSSELGSMGLSSDPAWPYYPYATLAYGTSKSALNAITLAYAKSLTHTHIKVNSVCPGLTATDLSGNYGTRTPAQGAAIAIKVALSEGDEPAASFRNDAGHMPW